MNSVRKMFQKSNDDRVALTHSKSMPLGSSSQGRMREAPRTGPSKPAYRGKTPLKKSDIVYVEQTRGCSRSITENCRNTPTTMGRPAQSLMRVRTYWPSFPIPLNQPRASLAAVSERFL